MQRDSNQLGVMVVLFRSSICVAFSIIAYTTSSCSENEKLFRKGIC